MNTVFLVENFFSPAQFSGHTITASSETAGQQALRVGSGRRHPRNKWRPTGTNADAWIEVLCDRTRVADMIVLDRGHNLEGKTIKLEVSDDDFTTKTEVFSLTVPSTVNPNSRLSDTPGVKTEEGAWLYRFPSHAGKYWRLFIPAASGLRPEIVGLYLGSSWEPSHPVILPFSFGKRELRYGEVVSDTLWVGASSPAARATHSVRLRLADGAEYDLARHHIEGLFMRFRPMWLVMDKNRAERSVLAIPPQGIAGFEIGNDWSEMQGEIPWVEHEPKLT